MMFFRKKLDERQEIETMRVANVAYGIAFIGLTVAIIVQLFIFNVGFSHVVGEFIVLIVIAVYSSIGYYRRGIWDIFTKPSIKAYLVYSFLGYLLFNLPVFARYFRNEAALPDVLTTLGLHFVIIFPALLAVAAGLGAITKRRQKALAEKYVDEN